jgi:hypothetical protein
MITERRGEHMNNRTQQRFDRSIADALRATKEAHARKPRRDLTAQARAMPSELLSEKGRLYLCPETGATVYDPNGTFPSRGNK